MDRVFGQNAAVALHHLKWLHRRGRCDMRARAEADAPSFCRSVCPSEDDGAREECDLTGLNWTGLLCRASDSLVFLCQLLFEMTMRNAVGLFFLLMKSCAGRLGRGRLARAQEGGRKADATWTFHVGCSSSRQKHVLRRSLGHQVRHHWPEGGKGMEGRSSG